MATLPGRCINILYCTTASAGEIIQVPAEGRFVCPTCSKTLVPPNTPLRRRAAGRNRPATLVRATGGAAGTLIGCIAFTGGILLGGLLFTAASAQSPTFIASAELRPATTLLVASLEPPEPSVARRPPAFHKIRRAHVSSLEALLR